LGRSRATIGLELSQMNRIFLFDAKGFQVAWACSKLRAQPPGAPLPPSGSCFRLATERPWKLWATAENGRKTGRGASHSRGDGAVGQDVGRPVAGALPGGVWGGGEQSAPAAPGAADRLAAAGAGARRSDRAGEAGGTGDRPGCGFEAAGPARLGAWCRGGEDHRAAGPPAADSG